MSIESYKNWLEEDVDFEKATLLLNQIVEHVQNYPSPENGGDKKDLFILVQNGISQTLAVNNGLLLESLAISAKRIADVLEKGFEDITEQED